MEALTEKSQLDTMQRPTTINTSRSQLLHLHLTEHHRRGRRLRGEAGRGAEKNVELNKKINKQKPQYQEVHGETVSPKNGFINKTRAMAISVGILMWKRERLLGFDS